MNRFRKILIFRQSSLGDVVLTFPVLACLVETYSGCRIDYVTKAPFAELVQSHPAVGTVYAFNDNHDFYRLTWILKRQRYDLLVDLQSNIRSRLLGILASPAKLVRYPKRRAAREMVVRRSQQKLNVDHTVSAYFSALRKIGVAKNPAPSFLTLPQEAQEFADDFLGKHDMCSKTLIAICPGARHYEKRWPHANFRNVALSLLERKDIGVVLITSAVDDIPVRMGIDSPSLIELKDEAIINVAALLSRCRIAISNDSGLMHLANAVGVPVLAIFGPTNPRLGFAPILPGSQVICDDVFCSPCSVHGEKPCRQPRKYCFENITSRRVTVQLMAMLGQR